MKKLQLFIPLAFVTLCFASVAAAQSGVNIHIGSHGIDVQPDAFVSYYQAPPDRVGWLRQESVPEEQWPLLFEIARAGNVSPERVWEIRRQRASWYDVLDELNVPPSYFYYDVPVSERLAPPYGRAYGYYRAHPTERVRWTDHDLVRLASVKYISDSTHRPAHEVVHVYEQHPHFIHTHEAVVVKHEEKHGKNDKHEKHGEQHGNNGHHEKHEHDDRHA